MINNNDFFEKSMEMQKKMMENYQKGLEQFTKNFDITKWTEGMPDFFKEMPESYQNFMKAIPEYYQNFMKTMPDYYKMWMGGENFSLPDYSEIMQKLFFSTDYYKSLYDMWNKLMESNMAFSPDKIDEFMKSTQKLIMGTMKSIIEPMVPEQYRAMFDGYDVFSEKYIDSLTTFFKPWMSNQEAISEAMRKMLSGDAEAVSEYISLINDAYDKSYGRILNVAGIGYNREINEEFRKGTDSYIRFMMSYIELMSSFAQVSNDASKEIAEKIMKMVQDSNNPMAFKDFYTVWLRTNADTFEKIFRTDSFSKMFGEFSANGYKFKIKMDDLLERYLSMLPIPTDKELKSLYKTVYDLRKENKDIKDQMESMSVKMEEMEKLLKAKQ